MISKTKVRKTNASKANANANVDSIVTHQSAVNRKGITLISLVITIVVLLILATVAISMAVDGDGLFTRARKAAEDWNESVADESTAIENALLIMNQIETGGTVGTDKPTNKPNEPELLTGMTPVKFTLPTGETAGIMVDTDSGDSDWYNYEAQKWANAKTKDGSLWVWIPRFAYKINGEESNPPIDVVFLKGTGDTYYDEEGILQTAKRATGEVADTKNDYYVHPAFTDESKLSTPYQNGGWDDELTGIWVAKFEAGYATSGSADEAAQVVDSNVKYSQDTVYAGKVERGEVNGETKDGSVSARNWLDGIYKTKDTMAIKYPVFQPLTYSMNYINHNDAYLLCKDLKNGQSMYGFNASEADTHLMKDSEWGAVSYLSKSKYGLGKTDIYINNINLNSGSKKREDSSTEGKTGIESAYAVTGVTEGGVDNAELTVKEPNASGITTVANNNQPVAGDDTRKVYKWNQTEGQKASTTGNMYGIYDLSGGVWEKTASYVPNGQNAITTYGKVLSDETDKKYVLTYTVDTEKDKTDIDAASEANYAKNKNIIGTAMGETSSTGKGNASWYGDYSTFVGLGNPFSVRGGRWSNGASVGLFYFDRNSGNSDFYGGFRAVLVGA